LIGEKAQCFVLFETSSEIALPVSLFGNKKITVSVKMIGK
jgi:hypothetical protein